MSSEGEHGYLDRALHRLALGSDAIAEMSFDIDQMMARPDADSAANGAHVFVSGLARAGTTVLMRRFHSTGQFRSLTYRDMPFILAPTLWGRLAGRFKRQTLKAERAHGDGLMVDADSPECFDEVYWRVFCGEDYLTDAGLKPHLPSAQNMAGYVKYVAAVLKSGATGISRYLSKNNNNILRLDALSQAFPKALFVVPFREPQAQSASLLRQHLKFCAAQKDGPFQLQYMNWLAHHEFGLGHRPFDLGGQGRCITDTTLPDYWLAIWIDVYSWLLESAPARARFVCYERLCADPGMWDQLRAEADLDGNSVPYEVLQAGRSETGQVFDRALADEAEALYQAMMDRSQRHGWTENITTTSNSGEKAE